MNWPALKSWIGARAVEKSTWIGIVVGGSTLAGVNLAPAKAEILETLGVTIATAALVATKEPSGTEAPPSPPLSPAASAPPPKAS
jgi:hypothetical protein